jgi:hypothetical protein
MDPTVSLPNNEVAILQMAWVRWFKLDTSQGPSGFHSLWYPTVSLLSRVWYILYYHRTSYSYHTFVGRGELLDGGGEKRRSR